MKLSGVLVNRLGEFCFACGRKFDKGSISGGRCLKCGTTIFSITEEQIKTEFVALPKKVKNKILAAIFN